jgi:hypothetical protein
MKLINPQMACRAKLDSATEQMSCQNFAQINLQRESGGNMAGGGENGGTET